MYAWYWPKDQPAAGNVVGGHRHDWESVVVWLDNPDSANPRILGAAASAHGKYSSTTSPKIQGNNVKVEYFVSFPSNHATQFTDTVGRTYWINDWDTMPNAAKDALAPPGLFRSANVPFRNDNFAGNLDKAAI